jgi:hypothetical protein
MQHPEHELRYRDEFPIVRTGTLLQGVYHIRLALRS